MDLVSKMKAELSNPDTVRSLQLQAQAGNKSAESLLELGANIKTYTKAEIDAAAKAKKSNNVLTNFMSAFESIIGGLKGSFIDGFLSPFTNAAGELDKDKVDAFFKSFKDLEPQLRDFGKAMGDIFRKVFTPANISSLLSGIVTFAKVMMAVIPVIGGFLKIVAGGLAKIDRGFEKLFSGFGLFGEGLNKTQKGFAALATGATALAAFLGAKVLIAKLGNWVKQLFGTLFGKTKTATMMVNAGEVFVNGGRGGGGGNDLDLGGGKKNRGSGKDRAARLKRLKALRGKGLSGKALSTALAAEEEAAAVAKPGLLGKAGRGLGKLAGGVSKIGGGIASKVGGFFGKMPFAGTVGKLGSSAKYLGKAAGLVGVAITAASVAGNLMDLHNQVNSGQISPDQAKKEAAKQIGGLGGGLAGG